MLTKGKGKGILKWDEQRQICRARIGVTERRPRSWYSLMGDEAKNGQTSHRHPRPCWTVLSLFEGL